MKHSLKATLLLIVLTGCFFVGHEIYAEEKSCIPMQDIMNDEDEEIGLLFDLVETMCGARGFFVVQGPGMDHYWQQRFKPSYNHLKWKKPEIRLRRFVFDLGFASIATIKEAKAKLKELEKIYKNTRLPIVFLDGELEYNLIRDDTSPNDDFRFMVFYYLKLDHLMVRQRKEEILTARNFHNSPFYFFELQEYPLDGREDVWCNHRIAFDRQSEIHYASTYVYIPYVVTDSLQLQLPDDKVKNVIPLCFENGLFWGLAGVDLQEAIEKTKLQKELLWRIIFDERWQGGETCSQLRSGLLEIVNSNVCKQ